MNSVYQALASIFQVLEDKIYFLLSPFLSPRTSPHAGGCSFHAVLQIFCCNNVFSPCTAIISIIKAQKCAKVLVGDPHQQIYGFKGATDAMALIHTDHTFHLTRVSMCCCTLSNTSTLQWNNLILLPFSFSLPPLISFPTHSSKVLQVWT